MATNVGIIAAPLVCGTLGEVYGWHYSFGVAGVGMLIGLAIYIAETRSLSPDRKPATVEKARSLKPEDPRMIWVLAAVFLIVTAFLTTRGPARQRLHPVAEGGGGSAGVRDRSPRHP